MCFAGYVAGDGLHDVALVPCSVGDTQAERWQPRVTGVAGDGLHLHCRQQGLP